MQVDSYSLEMIFIAIQEKKNICNVFNSKLSAFKL